MENNRLSSLGILLFYILFGIVLLFQFNSDYSTEEAALFLELMISYLWTAGLMVYAKIRLKLYFFEPISFIAILYELIFIVKPLIDLNRRDMVAHGINVFSGGEKATVIFSLGFTVLFFAYYVENTGSKMFRKKGGNILSRKIPHIEIDMKIIYLAWTIVFILCLISMSSQGLDFKYIFSLGTKGERIVDSDNVALQFLSNFGITLLTLWLIILIRAKSNAIKILISFFCVIYLLMRNGRWLVLVFIGSPIVYYYTKRHKSPNWGLICMIGAAGLVLFAWMQANRTALNMGGAYQGWGEKGFSFEILTAPFESDLNTYRTFFSMVNRYPLRHGYELGKSFLYTIVLFVPRVLWRKKPTHPLLDIIENSLNFSAKKAGTSVANIGEFYANFGILGVIFGMFIVGRIAKYMKRSLLDQIKGEEKTYGNDDKCIMYSILFPLLFQWIARGNFSSNFYMTIFAMLPFMIQYIIDFYYSVKRNG